MSLRLAFYVLMLIWLVFSFAWLGWYREPTAVGVYGSIGGSILIFVLFLILGWAVFGPPISGRD